MLYQLKRYKFGRGITSVWVPADVPPMRGHLEPIRRPCQTRAAQDAAMLERAAGTDYQPTDNPAHVAYYQAWQRKRAASTPATFKPRYDGTIYTASRKCKHCGERLPAASHPARRYCSETCRTSAQVARADAALLQF